MRLLLDTHVIYWWQLDRSKLPAKALSTIAAVESAVFVSVVSAWEIAIKIGAGKWPKAKGLLETFEQQMGAEDFTLLPITVSHVRAAGLMQTPHRDPFDRLLAAQSTIEGLTLVAADKQVQQLGAPWLW